MRPNRSRVRVVVQGGLGNQLFQLAWALRIAQPSRVVLDTTLVSGPERVAAEGYLLRRFACSDLVQALGARTTRVPLVPAEVYRKASNLLSRRGSLVRGPTGHLLVGSGISDFVPAPSDRRLAEAIVQCHPLAEVPLDRSALHVRLGDYRALAHVYGGPSAAYYRAALRAVMPDGGQVWVFSDEPHEAVAWLRTTAGTEYTFEPADGVAWPTEADGPWRDLVRMADCRRLIAANSTYSWWAAYLARLQHGEATTSVAPQVMTPTGLAAPPGALATPWTQADAIEHEASMTGYRNTEERVR